MNQPTPPQWYQAPDGRWYQQPPVAWAPVPPVVPRRSHRLLWTLLIIGAVVVAGGVTAAVVVVNGLPATETTIGSSLVMDAGNGGKADVTVRIVDPTTPIPGAYPAPAQSRYVTTVITVHNVGKGAIPRFEPGDVSLNGGNIREAAVGVTQCTGTNDADIPPGGTATACNTFEVTDGITVTDVQARFTGTDQTDVWRVPASNR